MVKVHSICLKSLGLLVLTIAGCSASINNVSHQVPVSKLASPSVNTLRATEPRLEISQSSDQENPIAPRSTAQSKQQPLDLNESQIASLKSLNIPIVVPTYLPDGFKLVQVEANLCQAGVHKTGCFGGSSYTLLYRNPEKACLLVHAVGDGVGGGAADFDMKVPSKLFGEVSLLFGERSITKNRDAYNASPNPDVNHPSPDLLNRPQPNLSTFPETLSSRNKRPPYYSVVAGTNSYDQEKYGCSGTPRVTPSDLIKVLDGLTVLE